ncbi:MAG: hypothetical protein Q4G33_10945 [bacterium]|nr:hypothetical protein [bacterium]
MNVYDIANWVTGCFEAYYMYLLFETFLKHREGVPKWIYYAVSFCAAILINISNYLFFSLNVLNYPLMMLIGFVISFAYKGRSVFRFLTSVLWMMISAVAEVLTIFALSIVFNAKIEEIIEQGYLRLIGIAISKILGYIFIKFITSKSSRNIKYINASYWGLFVFMFLSSALVMGTFCKVLADGTSKYVYNLIMLCSCGVVCTTIAVLYLFERMLKQQDLLAQQHLLKMQLENQVKHYRL